MNELHYIRRVRRPLIVQDASPVNAGSAEPVEAKAQTTDNGPQTTGPAEAGTPCDNDAPTTSIAAE